MSKFVYDIASRRLLDSKLLVFPEPGFSLNCRCTWLPVEKPMTEQEWLDSVTDRLVSKTRKVASGCIEWMGSLNKYGYGKISVSRSKHRGAHRVAYLLFVGQIPEGAMVLHDCDNPACVNPIHLKTGTHIDNMHDMSSRGRWNGYSRSGQQHHAAILDDSAVLEARNLAERVGQRQASRELSVAWGIPEETIRGAIRKRRLRA